MRIEIDPDAQPWLTKRIFWKCFNKRIEFWLPRNLQSYSGDSQSNITLFTSFSSWIWSFLLFLSKFFMISDIWWDYDLPLTMFCIRIQSGPWIWTREAKRTPPKIKVIPWLKNWTLSMGSSRLLLELGNPSLKLKKKNIAIPDLKVWIFFNSIF